MITETTYRSRKEGERTGLLVNYSEAASALVHTNLGYECPICRIQFIQAQSGFVKSTAERHVYACQMREFELAQRLITKKPTKIQLAVLRQLARGAVIEIDLHNCSHYISTSGDSVNKRTVISLREAGWLAGLALTDQGRRTLELGGVMPRIERRHTRRNQYVESETIED
jgi:hypothetical protein